MITAVDWFSAWVAPPHCLLCGGQGSRRDICSPCRRDLPWRTRSCQSCAAPLPDGLGVDYCGACQRAPAPPFQIMLAALDYEWPVSRLIALAKYSSRPVYTRLLGELLALAVGSSTAVLPELLVPVPLHRRRLAQRGYNQAEEIARWCGRSLELPVVGDMARRTKPGPPQATLDRRGRRRAVRGAFTCSAGVRGRSIAVVDDVVTTGSTVHALAKALRNSGAAAISVWAVAGTGVQPGRKM